MLASIWVPACAYFFFRKKISGGGVVSLPEVAFRIMVMLFIYQIILHNLLTSDCSMVMFFFGPWLP